MAKTLVVSFMSTDVMHSSSCMLQCFSLHAEVHSCVSSLDLLEVLVVSFTATDMATDIMHCSPCMLQRFGLDNIIDLSAVLCC